ncbi:MAG: VWA domain-containing protein [Phycisphaeraceae bacterium]|nr:VWA domain-containing protein [Phycisphaeraceae bacterium]MCW5753079.1 VWA domain-containing protein [Phycisphaeraceae bacterium]
MLDRFAHPEFLLLLVLAPVWLARAYFGRKRGQVVLSSVGLVAGGRSWRTWSMWAPPVLRAACLVCVVTALARPQQTTGQTRISTEGIAIMMVIDRSASMTAPMEFGGRQTTRFDVVQRVFSEFILGDDAGLTGRPADMIGLVAFAGFADTISPLVQSHRTLVRLANAVQPAPPAEPEGGTAIGDALALAAARLESAESQIQRMNQRSTTPPAFKIKSKVIVLLTDGENNRGRIEPLEAARFARERNIKIYTIGIGGEGGYVYIPGVQPNTRIPIRDTIDERNLTEIAQMTGGRYWNARTADALRQCYRELDQLERSTIDLVEYQSREERFMPWVGWAIMLLVLEIALRGLVFRRLV